VSFHVNIIVCKGCDHRQRPCAGPCPCKIDGVDSIAHAKADYCPHPDGPRFGTSTKPASWPLVPLPIVPDAEIQAILDAGDPGGCNC
jgi:hypothetical protein